MHARALEVQSRISAVILNFKGHACFGGTQDRQAASNTYTFKVDTKVNLTVATTDGAAIPVTPGGSAALTFTVTNTGNSLQDYNLTAVAVVTDANNKFVGTDDIDATTATCYVESGATGGYQSAEDTATSIDNLAAGSSKTVYIVGVFPTGLDNGDYASYHLRATALDSAGGAQTETASDDADPNVVDIVIADGIGSDAANDTNRDSEHSSQSDFIVAAASLSVAKTSTLISDPINNTTNPKRIPGAVVEYTTTISNGAGASDATDITFTDSLDGEITAGTIAYNPGTIKVQAPNLYSNVETTLSDTGGNDEGDWNVTGTNSVTVSDITLTAGQSATIKFQVTVQ